MDNQVQIQKILEKMEENTRKQLFYSRIQFVCTIVLTAGCFALFLKFNSLLPQLELIISHAEQVLSNLESITDQLQKLDMAGMVENINNLVTTSQEGVDQALGAMKEIEFDTLNEAIEDLAAIIQPMADFIKRFNLGGR